MQHPLADAPLEVAKLTPPAAAVVSGATGDQLVLVLTVIYLICLIVHKIWAWRNEHSDRRERRSGVDRRQSPDRRSED
jgi:membrane-anchored protein YejM (alkaline phosphatase superfamily)